MTLSHTLQSSPNQDQDQRPQSLFSLHLSSVSLSNLNLISLTLSLRHRLNSQVSNVLTSLSLSISDKYSNQKPEISSPNPLVSHKRSLSLTL